MRKDVKLCVGDACAVLKVKWNSDQNTEFKERHGDAIDKELSWFLCEEIKRKITPELIQSLLFDA